LTERDQVLSVAVYVLKNILKLLHPFAPFITEEIWSLLNHDKILLATASYPSVKSEFTFSDQKENIEFLMSVISSIRNIKTNLSVSSKNKISILCRGSSEKIDILLKNSHHLSQLLNIVNIDFGKNIDKPDQSATAVVENLEIFLPLEGLIDIDKEIARLESKINDIKARMDNVKKKLDNKNFISRAPEKIVNHEQKKYDSYLEDYNKLVENHSAIVSKK
jgi:valyl-tRNA synthetase